MTAGFKVSVSPCLKWFSPDHLFSAERPRQVANNAWAADILGQLTVKCIIQFFSR
jgi:hypothetical protein